MTRPAIGDSFLFQGERVTIMPTSLQVPDYDNEINVMLPTGSVQTVRLDQLEPARVFVVRDSVCVLGVFSTRSAAETHRDLKQPRTTYTLVIDEHDLDRAGDG